MKIGKNGIFRLFENAHCTFTQGINGNFQSSSDFQKGFAEKVCFAGVRKLFVEKCGII